MGWQEEGHRVILRDGRIGYRHLRIFRDVPRLPALLDEVSGNAPTLRRLLSRFRRHVDRMRREITRAMLADPNPPSLEDILAQLALSQL